MFFSTFTILFLAAEAYFKPSVQVPWEHMRLPLLIRMVVSWLKSLNVLSNTLQYYIFKDVGFSKPPTGARRFNVPSYPDPISNPTKVQDRKGTVCWQVNTFNNNCEAATKTSPNVPEGALSGSSCSSVVEDEDYLFLDVYVPEDFSPEEANIPVIV